MSKKKSKSQKLKVAFRKNREVRTREQDLTRRYATDALDEDQQLRSESIGGKGELGKKRTVVGELIESDAGEFTVLPDVNEAICLAGRVLSVRGLISEVQTDDGQIYPCATRRVLKTLATDQRHVVAAGDRVLFRPEGDEGIIERVEPRHGILCRTSRGRKHIIVTNVDMLVIVASAAEPRLKPHLIDRFLVTAEKHGIEPLICVNKIDLVDAADLQPTLGVFAQMGYATITVSAETGQGIPQLQQRLAGRETVLSGQSGVGKSTLLNFIEPGLGLRTSTVSTETSKGRHTTTTAELLPLSFGGFVVDTPGIRQFQLWDVIAEEVCGFFRDLRPYESKCRFPNCTHTHESDCAIKDAVADGRLDARRYESYCHLHAGDMA